jgi:hypothetical protein
MQSYVGQIPFSGRSPVWEVYQVPDPIPAGPEPGSALLSHIRGDGVQLITYSVVQATNYVAEVFTPIVFRPPAASVQSTIASYLMEHEDETLYEHEDETLGVHEGSADPP